MKYVFFLFSIGIVSYFAWKKPAILPSLLAGAVAFDISITWFPPLGPLGSQLNSFARLLTVGIIGAALWRLGREPEKRQELKAILTHFMTRAFLIYLAAGAFSLLYSIDRGKTAVELIRLFTLFLLYLGICLLGERKHALLPFQVVHWVGVALVPLTLYEGITKHFIWRGYLAEGEIARVNATFVDPNILARYLVLAIVANLILQYLNDVTWKRGVYFGALLGLLGALAITLSRSGILTLVIVVTLLILFIPRKRMVLPIGLLGLIGAVMVALQPAVRERLLTIKIGFGALGEQRAYLCKVSRAMFIDHPIFGVGLGGFEKMFLTPRYIIYKTVIPYVQGVTLSHTTILTIAAELGLMGLAALAWVWFALVRVLLGARRIVFLQANCEGMTHRARTSKADLDRGKIEQYLPVVGYFLWIVAVFISSQAEARFFEDPIIWLSMGMMLRLSGGVGSEQRHESKIAAH
ncbi:O-antigen ligase family protein [Desulfosporosinus sp. BG]|uniref:O-antigen ligase family protein n=1 Tax=Desulfosporosinus sp. BG TaxID=1633135 RepID=UPI001FA760C2|nr:O-antigen ligase family protein [Desulfosporosinus sp. BG]